jgi:hypothetical protein
MPGPRGHGLGVGHMRFLGAAFFFFTILGSSTGGAARGTQNQGLTLVHFSAQRERILWDRGCM